MHPRLQVPRRIAGDGRGHQKPDQAAKHSDGRDEERRIEKVIAATRVGAVRQALAMRFNVVRFLPQSRKRWP
jgi:hypothetical protein